MLCDNCKKKQASIHFVKVINGQKTEVHLCDECAPKNKIDSFSGFGFGIGDILNNMLGGPTYESRLVCDVCKTDFNTFSKTGKLGCSNCYDVFSDYLDAPMKRIHGASKHIGKIPIGMKEQPKKENKLEHLKSQLAEAIKNEEFENAAKLRDEIRKIEGGGAK